MGPRPQVRQLYGTKLILTCTASGNPYPHFTWVQYTPSGQYDLNSYFIWVQWVQSIRLAHWKLLTMEVSTHSLLQSAIFCFHFLYESSDKFFHFFVTWNFVGLYFNVSSEQPLRTKFSRRQTSSIARHIFNNSNLFYRIESNPLGKRGEGAGEKVYRQNMFKYIQIEELLTNYSKT